MPRYALGFALLFALVAASAQAQQVTWTGSVKPVGPTGFPTDPFDPPIYDLDGDGLNDWLSATGNEPRISGVVGTQPDGSAGGSPWNSANVWASYDTPQNILVGDAYSSGTLALGSFAQLRYQYLVIGGVSADIPLLNSNLDFESGTPDAFDLQVYLQQVPEGTGGTGIVSVQSGSVFNNDPNVIPVEYQVAMNAALGNSPTFLLTDLANSTVPGAVNLTTREFGNQDEAYDVIVGLNGTGVLNVETAGQVEIQDALMVAVDQGSSGTVVVDGIGSRLVAFGREEFENNGAIMPSQNEATSFIGGRGTGSMTVSAGGQAQFYNGLAIGAPTGRVGNQYLSNRAKDGSGLLTVTGPGSNVTAYASNINSFNAFGTTLALMIGEFNNQPAGSLADPIDPAEANTQPGTLVIADGGVVATTFLDDTTGYNTSEDEANAAIGAGGTVQLADGSFHVGNQLLSDGEISGYGTVRARSLDTSVYSVIRGGDSTAENPAASQPLRLQLNGEIGDVISDLNLADDTNFINRGLVSGLVEIDAPGDIENQGDIAIGGEIFARSILTTSTSTIVGGGSGQGLTIRLDSTDQADSPTPSLQNYGLLAGKVNLQTPGAVVNGQEMSTPGLPISGANGGEIAVDGTLEVGSFLNNRFGQVTVGAGESLRVLATGDPTTLTPVNAPVTGYAPIVEDGATPAGATNGAPTVADFYTANLGSIAVNGGSFEIGLVTETTTTTTTVTGVTLTEHANLFRNARYVNTTGATNDYSIGTITSNDGELKFRNGVYNTGVMAFTGGDNTVSGLVVNSGLVGYAGGADPFPGVIVVSGENTTVTFEDHVYNAGVISIGPYGNVANFLGDLTVVAGSTLQIAQDFNLVSQGAAIVVDGMVTINGGAVTPFPFLTDGTVFDTGDTFALLQAGELAEESLFTELNLPTLAAGKYWDVIYDTIEDQILLEVVESIALGADFNGDGMVTQDDVDVWARNAGITSGASVIQGDADLDGDVDLADYGHLMDQLFTGVPVLVGSPVFAETPAVPEPAAALLCLLAVSAAASRRR